MSWHYEDQVLRIRKMVVGPLENNVYVVACAATGQAVIIDAAAEPDVIEAGVADVEPIAILTTHGHHDHVGAAAETRRRLGIPFRIHDADASRAGIPPDLAIEHGDEIAVGAVRLRAVHTPGHTAGSVCFTARGHLFSGDTLFPGGPGATHSPGSDFDTIIASLERHLFTLPDETVVHPGHGLDTTIGTERPSLPEWIARRW